MRKIGRIIVRHAQMKDYENIKKFISKEWEIGKCDEYFRYYQVVGERLTFVIAVEEERNIIYGTCGYVLTNLDKFKVNLQLVLLLVPSNGGKVSSLSLFQYMIEQMKPYTISSCGVRDKALALYKFLGYKTGQMDHFCMFTKKNEYKIAVVKQQQLKEGSDSKFSMRRFLTIEDVEEVFDFDEYKNQNPYKDRWCIKHRYFDSIYHYYEVYGIFNEYGKCKSLLVFREIQAKGEKAARIVDCVGEYKNIAYIYQPMMKILMERGYEFMDFQSVGIKEEIMNAGGFFKLNLRENIIPHLYEPFVQENKVINYFTSKKEEFVMFIGDCDQDRANIFK